MTICNHCKDIPDKFVSICDITDRICGADIIDHIYCEKITELEEKYEEYRQENINLDKENELLYRTLMKIEKFCNEILADILHYSQGTINTAEKIRNIIKKAKGEQ